VSRTFDLYDPSFPHGTVDGYRQGCHGSACGSAIACRDVYRRYQGDYSFRKLIDAGMTAAEIAARDEAEREATRQRDRQAAIAERRREAAARKPARVRAVRAPRPPKAPKPPREPRATAATAHAAEIARLRGEGLDDGQIAEQIGISRDTVGRVRRHLGLAPVVVARIPRVGRELRPRKDRRADVARLHAQGLRDDEVAAELGIAPAYAGTLRRDLKLPAHRKERAARKRTVYQRRRDRRPEVAEAHAEGLTDRQIGEKLGLHHSEVGRLRRELKLTAHRPATRRRSPEKLQPHGTNACYARGCRREECVAANREYHRQYKARRRAEPLEAVHHGTPYGYQLGCRGRSACPAEVSCTDAMLAEERRRRREAGVPAAAPRVDAAPVREHVRTLMAGGMTLDAIATASGVHRSRIGDLIYGRSGDRKGVFADNVEASKAERLLAVEVARA
jgi:DNA-binding NarL/FixJ family response regulator